MILSVSRRTDIPRYYGDWFLNRLKEEYVCVRNPMNLRQISRCLLYTSALQHCGRGNKRDSGSAFDLWRRTVPGDGCSGSGAGNGNRPA